MQIKIQGNKFHTFSSGRNLLHTVLSFVCTVVMLYVVISETILCRLFLVFTQYKNIKARMQCNLAMYLKHYQIDKNHKKT